MTAKALSVRWEDDCTRYIVLGHLTHEEFVAALREAPYDECSLPYEGEPPVPEKLERTWLRYVPTWYWESGKKKWESLLRRASGPGPGAFPVTIWLIDGVDFDTPEDRAAWRDAGGYR